MVLLKAAAAFQSRRDDSSCYGRVNDSVLWKSGDAGLIPLAPQIEFMRRVTCRQRGRVRLQDDTVTAQVIAFRRNYAWGNH